MPNTLLYVDGHRLHVLADGAILWEHDATPGYRPARHQVAPVTPTTWRLVSMSPVTVTPSLFCDPSRGGCGRHGFITDGRWSGA